MPVRIAIIGVGKIARDQHLPSIAADDRLALAALVSRHLREDEGVPGFATLSDLLASPMRDQVDAVSIATPPGVRHAIAREALDAGLDVMLEKPPAATLGEIEDLDRLARDRGRVLFAGWHSQANQAVDEARALFAGQAIRTLRVEWWEDARKWHPGQDWLFEPSGFGVFDPGINALSILTRILPEPLFVREAHLSIPANRQAPIAARLDFGEGRSADFDFRHTEGEHWTIRVETGEGRTVLLEEGGARLTVDGEERVGLARAEYPALYARFAELVAARTSEVDCEPLRIVADAMLVARRETVDPFEW